MASPPPGTASAGPRLAVPAGAPAHAGLEPPGTREAAILEAALGVFATRGALGATIGEVRAAAGASIGSLYHRFGSKQGIAAAVFREGLRRYQTGMLGELANDPTARDGVRAVVAHHLRWVVEDRDWAAYLVAVRPADVQAADDERLGEQNRAFFAAVERWRRPLAERGELRALAPELAHALWLGPADTLTRRWLETGRPDPAALQAPLADAAWTALRADPAATDAVGAPTQPEPTIPPLPDQEPDR